MKPYITDQDCVVEPDRPVLTMLENVLYGLGQCIARASSAFGAAWDGAVQACKKDLFEMEVAVLGGGARNVTDAAAERSLLGQVLMGAGALVALGAGLVKLSRR